MQVSCLASMACMYSDQWSNDLACRMRHNTKAAFPLNVSADTVYVTYRGDFNTPVPCKRGQSRMAEETPLHGRGSRWLTEKNWSFCRDFGSLKHFVSFMLSCSQRWDRLQPQRFAPASVRSFAHCCDCVPITWPPIIIIRRKFSLCSREKGRVCAKLNEGDEHSEVGRQIPGDEVREKGADLHTNSAAVKHKHSLSKQFKLGSHRGLTRVRPHAPAISLDCTLAVRQACHLAIGLFHDQWIFHQQCQHEAARRSGFPLKVSAWLYSVKLFSWSRGPKGSLSHEMSLRGLKSLSLEMANSAKSPGY